MKFSLPNHINPSILMKPPIGRRRYLAVAAMAAAFAASPLACQVVATAQEAAATPTESPAQNPIAEPTEKPETVAKAKLPAFAPMVKHWENASFGGDGAIEIKKHLEHGVEIEMMPGDPITGIRWSGEFPNEDYELRLQARRVDGFDFFAAVTFPVGEEQCSFVLGGWGGGMVGISSIDGSDASANETTQYKEFETDQWYTIRIRVDEMNVTCWIDDVEFATVPRAEHTLDIRIEMDPCLPVGIANFMTRSELRNIGLRKLSGKDGEKHTVKDTKPGQPAK